MPAGARECTQRPALRHAAVAAYTHPCLQESKADTHRQPGFHLRCCDVHLSMLGVPHCKAVASTAVHPRTHSSSFAAASVPLSALTSAFIGLKRAHVRTALISSISSPDACSSSLSPRRPSVHPFTRKLVEPLAPCAHSPPGTRQVRAALRTLRGAAAPAARKSPPPRAATTTSRHAGQGKARGLSPHPHQPPLLPAPPPRRNAAADGSGPSPMEAWHSSQVVVVTSSLTSRPPLTPAPTATKFIRTAAREEPGYLSPHR